jgi:uncharacterized protein YhhL (DUF1145 family)
MALAVVRNEFCDVRNNFQTMLQVASYVVILVFGLQFFLLTAKYHSKR